MEKFSSRVHTLFFYIMCWRPLQLYVCFLIFLLINMMAAHLLYFVTYIYTRKRDTPQGRHREKNVCQGERGKKKRSVGGTPLLFNFFSLSDEHSGASSSYLWFSRGPSGVPDSVVMIMTLCEHTY